MNPQQKPVLTGHRFKTRKRDEKEKFEPTVFRDTIVSGLNEAGGDLDAVAKFLDATGSRLDYRRYADALFDILIAGSMLAPGGTRIDEGDRTKAAAHCVFTAEESHAALRLYAQVPPVSTSWTTPHPKPTERRLPALCSHCRCLKRGSQRETPPRLPRR
uniref:5MP1/2-like HEAT domain-containing protein n=1 Tax=Salarias fasciatus TaxID=181472 RepID=A0A672GMY3_SALFA